MYGSRQEKKKKIKKVNHMNTAELKNKIEELKGAGQGESKHCRDMITRLNSL